jgi:hypothetical protein
MSFLLGDGRALYNHTIEISHEAISGTEEEGVEFPNGENMKFMLDVKIRMDIQMMYRLYSNIA